MATGYAQYSRHSLPYPTDHWSKTKIKTFRRTQLPTGNVIVLCAPEVPTLRTRRYSLDITQFNRAGLVSRGMGSSQLNAEMNTELPPLTLSHHLSTPGPGTSQRPHRVSSAITSQDRAKRGFKYWVDESKPSGNPKARVTMGCKGTFLGMGVPRL
ncbi:PREDICTED: uncharacterized protein LOC100633286 [Amphimedon queenslandica]|uniref:Uncharacterized protein n=1 Tax=Amphimedon queenslandica TaxID=400682 RepID=A0A1X7VM73_AMPQE|nr:PREDICTED: uncharacterized protein LOC100633286 [Amphimedon queenslandica]|eukprot:XP_003383559.1 PREDICTED: uncharacterized protein LOC100633286 [Amphimedon queenslandica]